MNWNPQWCRTCKHAQLENEFQESRDWVCCAKCSKRGWNDRHVYSYHYGHHSSVKMFIQGKFEALEFNDRFEPPEECPYRLEYLMQKEETNA